MQKKGIGKCKSERGTHMTIAENMGEQNANLKDAKLQMEEK